MYFVLRATLVVGVLSYLALQRDGRDVTAAIPEPAAMGAALSGAWDGLAPNLREQAMREGANDLVRRMAAPISAAAPASRDTLAEADRRPAWRGAAAH